MIASFKADWMLYWSVAAAVGLIWFRFTRTDRKLSHGARLRSLLRGNRYFDPQSPSYDPNLPGRQVVLLLIGFPLIFAALLIAWIAAE